MASGLTSRGSAIWYQTLSGEFLCYSEVELLPGAYLEDGAIVPLGGLALVRDADAPGMDTGELTCFPAAGFFMLRQGPVPVKRFRRLLRDIRIRLALSDERQPNLYNSSNVHYFACLRAFDGRTHAAASDA